MQLSWVQGDPNFLFRSQTIKFLCFNFSSRTDALEVILTRKGILFKFKNRSIDFQLKKELFNPWKNFKSSRSIFESLKTRQKEIKSFLYFGMKSEKKWIGSFWINLVPEIWIWNKKMNVEKQRGRSSRAVERENKWKPNKFPGSLQTWSNIKKNIF